MKPLSIIFAGVLLLFGCSSFKTRNSDINAKPSETVSKTEAIVIIANPSVTATTISPDELSEIYLLKKRV